MKSNGHDFELLLTGFVYFLFAFCFGLLPFQWTNFLGLKPQRASYEFVPNTFSSMRPQNVFIGSRRRNHAPPTLPKMISICLLFLLSSAYGAYGLHHNHLLSKSLQDSVGCWDKSVKPNARVFHLHTPKVAGCSVVEDLSRMIGRDEVFSHEMCFSNSAIGFYKETVVMVRKPRDHVLSQYEFCKAATDPGYRDKVGENQGLPGQKKHYLASSFGKWIDEWRNTPRFGNYNIYHDYEQCYCPWNLQTSRLQCSVESWAFYCHPEPDLEEALKSLNATTMLGASRNEMVLQDHDF